MKKISIIAAACLAVAAFSKPASAQGFGISLGVHANIYASNGPGLMTYPAWYTHPYAQPVVYTPHTVMMRNDLPRKHYRYAKKRGFYAGGHAPRHHYVNRYNGYAPQYGFNGPMHGYYPY